MADQATDLDHNNDGPQTTYEGQRWTVEIDFYLPGDLTEAEVEEGVVWALGGGSIASDHPLVDGDFRNVVCHRARAFGLHKFIDWQAKGEDDTRHGRVRIERQAPEQVPA